MRSPEKSRTKSMNNLTHTGYSITLIWIPSNNQVPGNERADEKARQAINSTNAVRLNYFTLHDAKFITRIIPNNIWQRALKQGTSKLNQSKYQKIKFVFGNNSKSMPIVIQQNRVILENGRTIVDV